MRRALGPLLFLGAAILVGLVVGVVVLRGGDEDPAGELTPEELALTRARVNLTGTLEPRTHLFGARVNASVEALFDPRRVRTGSVRVEPVFNPYEIASESRTVSQAGDFTRVRFDYVLQCLRQGCTPSSDKRRFDLPPAIVYFTVVGVGPSQGNVQLAPLEVVSRLGPFDLDQARWRADTRSVPEATYRIDPGLLAAGLLGGAGLLALAAVGLVLVSRPRRAGELDEEADEAAVARSALERALELAEAHSRNGTTPEGRMALERLARELLDLGHPDLAGRARRLAWSPPQRPNGDVSSFTAEVRERTAPEDEVEA